MTNKIVVLVTCGNFTEANRIARDLVEARIAACVNLLESPIRSIYRWKSEVESASEYLLLIKSTQAEFRRIRKRVQEIHSYDVPEVIALPVVRGSRAYLAWISANVGAAASGRRSEKRAETRRAR